MGRTSVACFIVLLTIRVDVREGPKACAINMKNVHLIYLPGGPLTRSLKRGCLVAGRNASTLRVLCVFYDVGLWSWFIKRLCPNLNGHMFCFCRRSEENALRLKNKTIHN